MKDHSSVPQMDSDEMADAEYEAIVNLETNHMEKLTIGEQILAVKTKIAERALIIYVAESAIADNDYPVDYKGALNDEIENHNIAIAEYKEQLSILENTKL